ncbi:MAG: DUF3795 domain-containing protein [Bacteroidales bacterium]|jgi:hypothetical protein|nr:DUF3795 domain-containing protein [Bacteroidales bacterium]
MEDKYACYCGLCCKNCAVKVKVEPAARTLYDEMGKLGFADIMSFFPDGEKFWSFLKMMSTEGVCISCQAGSGNPVCTVRQCAKEKNVQMCALCDEYPCEHFKGFFDCYPSLKNDNAVLREKGWDSWKKLQDERLEKGESFP